MCNILVENDDQIYIYMYIYIRSQFILVIFNIVVFTADNFIGT